MDDAGHTLNQACHCRTLNVDMLRRQLADDDSLSPLAATLALTRPHMFSATSVFMSSDTAARIDGAVAALERVMALPGYQAAALARAPAIARQAFGPMGAFMGYDFHLAPEGPKLIEVNTNAGGGLLNAALARAQQACCVEMDWAFRPNPRLADMEARFMAMFQREWQLQRGDVPLGRVALVDDAPQGQYLAPEFELGRQMFERHGVAACIVEATVMQWRDGRLVHEGQVIDMVYNRLTDFYLTDPAHAALRQAYESGAVVLTPHPRAHAIHAAKHNLVDFGDDARLQDWGAADADRQILAAVVPRTVPVTPASAEALWRDRRQWFFKPVSGYGAKGAYRGDKLTRGVWQAILSSDYIAQAVVPPGERAVEVDGRVSELKFDVRAYSYAGQVQLLAARMYSGQTTNFRTPGGGFAPVVVLPGLA